jgi:hypothetical protein
VDREQAFKRLDFENDCFFDHKVYAIALLQPDGLVHDWERNLSPECQASFSELERDALFIRRLE